MSKSTIKDPRVKIRPSLELLKFLNEHENKIEIIPENIANALKANGFDLTTHVELITDTGIQRRRKIPDELLQTLNEEQFLKEASAPNNKSTPKPADQGSQDKKKLCETYLYLNDLYWLTDFLALLRKSSQSELFLHDVLQSCELILPENETIPRNPELEKRCQKLRAEQENREYQKMTKNVDALRKKHPEDTISYQMKAINKQLVAVFQFVVSVITGFVFGFWGLPLLFGTLQFGLRLLLGIAFALIIALAEMYFLAKKLIDFDDAVDGHNRKTNKLHVD